MYRTPSMGPRSRTHGIHTPFIPYFLSFWVSGFSRSPFWGNRFQNFKFVSKRNLLLTKKGSSWCKNSQNWRKQGTGFGSNLQRVFGKSRLQDLFGDPVKRSPVILPRFVPFHFSSVQEGDRNSSLAHAICTKRGRNLPVTQWESDCCTGRMLSTWGHGFAFSGYFPFSKFWFFPAGGHAHAGGLAEMALLSWNSQCLLLRKQHSSGTMAEMDSQAGDVQVYWMGWSGLWLFETGFQAAEFLLGLLVQTSPWWHLNCEKNPGETWCQEITRWEAVGKLILPDLWPGGQIHCALRWDIKNGMWSVSTSTAWGMWKSLRFYAIHSEVE